MNSYVHMYVYAVYLFAPMGVCMYVHILCVHRNVHLVYVFVDA